MDEVFSACVFECEEYRSPVLFIIIPTQDKRAPSFLESTKKREISFDGMEFYLGWMIAL